MSTTNSVDHQVERARWRARNRVADLLAMTGAIALVLPLLTVGPNQLQWLSTFITAALILCLASRVAAKTARRSELSLTDLVERFAAGLRKQWR